MKRKRLGLRKRRGRPVHSNTDIRNAVIHLLPNIPWTAGYRNIHQTLKHLGFDVRRDTVMNIVRDLDPVGVNERRRRRLQRRRYVSPGSDYNWHVDGYDKLKPYGFAVHGAIDGYSRRIIWLEVNPSNNNPNFIARHFMESVRQRKGCPHLLTTDPGTENAVMAALQAYFRQNGTDDFNGSKSHRYVTSTANQRIEAWWCLFRRDRMEWWIEYFTNLSHTAAFNKCNEIHIFALRYCFMPLLKQEIRAIVERWNNHYNNGNRMGKCPPGRPNILYHTGDSFLHEIDEMEIQFGFRQTQVQTRSGSAEFDEYANNIFATLSINDATNVEEAERQYIYLKDVADN